MCLWLLCDLTFYDFDVYDFTLYNIDVYFTLYNIDVYDDHSQYYDNIN